MLEVGHYAHYQRPVFLRHSEGTKCEWGAKQRLTGRLPPNPGLEEQSHGAAASMEKPTNKTQEDPQTVRGRNSVL